MINLDKVSEGITYELIPVDESPNDAAWDIRILEGQYVESILRFGKVALHEDGKHLAFNFEVVSSPDDTLTENDEALQDFAAEVLEDIMERAINEGNLVTRDNAED